MAETTSTYLHGGAKFKVREVFFEGSTALRRGQGVCYNADSGTAADVVEGRYSLVEVCSTTNNRNFAGVTTQAYSAVTGGQRIKIYEPGGCAWVWAGIDTTVNSTYLTCSATDVDTGCFTEAGFMGRGTALALQTITGGVIFDGRDSTGSVNGTTLTDTGVGTASTAGDVVMVLAGNVTANGDTEVTTGETTVASVTNANVVELTDTISAAASIINYYTQGSSTPVVFAYLFDGPESGLQEWLSVANATALTHMVGGVTRLSGGLTITADATGTLANGSFVGEMKRFYLEGALTTQDYLLTVTSGIYTNGTASLNSIEFDADADNTTLIWTGGVWAPHTNGATEA